MYWWLIHRTSIRISITVFKNLGLFFFLIRNATYILFIFVNLYRQREQISKKLKKKQFVNFLLKNWLTREGLWRSDWRYAFFNLSYRCVPFTKMIERLTRYFRPLPIRKVKNTYNYYLAYIFMHKIHPRDAEHFIKTQDHFKNK